MAYGRRRRRIKAFFKSINYTRIFIRALNIFFIACILWLALDKLEGKMIHPAALKKFLGNIYDLLSYPCVVWLYWHSPDGWYIWPAYFFCLFLDCYLYAVAIGLILFPFSSRFRKSKVIMGASETNIKPNEIFLIDMFAKVQRLRRANDSSRRLSYASRKLSHSSKKLSNSSRRVLHSSRKLSDSSRKLSYLSRRLSDSSRKLLYSSQRVTNSFRRFSLVSRRVKGLSQKLSYLSRRVKDSSRKF